MSDQTLADKTLTAFLSRRVRERSVSFYTRKNGGVRLLVRHPKSPSLIQYRFPDNSRLFTEGYGRSFKAWTRTE